MDTQSLISKIGIKQKWLADRLDIPESVLRYHLQQGMPVKYKKMIKTVLEFNYKKSMESYDENTPDQNKGTDTLRTKQ